MAIHQHRRAKGSNSKVEVELTVTSKKLTPSSKVHSETRSRSLIASLGIKSQTIQAVLILSLAILTSVVWNVVTIERDDAGFVSSFLVSVFGGTAAFCHTAMAARRRTLAAVKGVIRKHETVLEIPRSFTIWDLDALRNPWVQRELFAARVSGTKPLPAASFLAAYLSRLLFPDEGATNAAQKDNWNLSHPILHEYLSILPNKIEDFAFHPLLWSEQDLKESLGPFTYTYDLVMSVRRSVNEEYEALAKASVDFQSQINYEQYQVARLNVMTRSFGTGKVHTNEAGENEIAYYQKVAGVDLSHGCHAMVPVLDMYDHHAQPNVGFSYNPARRSFVVTAVRVIPAGAEIFDSYGKRTDSDLFAKYGFVNGDGSDYTEASLALWHHVDPEATAPNVELPQLKKRVVRYLQYDDGYESCVFPHSSDAAWELKRLKYLHLLMVASLPQRWVIRMPPRDSFSLPATSKHKPLTFKPPVFDMRRLQFDGSWLFSTCRLIVLTHDDYNGSALELLQSNLQNSSFFLHPTRTALEFRTLMCIARMAQTALGRFGVTVQDQLDQVSLFNRVAFRSLNWTVAHLRLGEMQTLEALKQTAFAGLQPFRHEINSGPSFSMRDNPCPPQALQTLLDDGQ